MFLVNTYYKNYILRSCPFRWISFILSPPDLNLLIPHYLSLMIPYYSFLTIIHVLKKPPLLFQNFNLTSQPTVCWVIYKLFGCFDYIIWPFRISYIWCGVFSTIWLCFFHYVHVLFLFLSLSYCCFSFKGRFWKPENILQHTHTCMETCIYV